jgi:hypothetical protein
VPTFRHGRGTFVLVDKYDLTTYLREAGVASTVDLAETSAFGTFDKTFVVGMRERRLSLAGMFDGSVNAVDAVLNTILGQEAAVVCTYAPEGLTVGRRTYLIQSEETSHEVSSPITDVVAVSAELQGTDTGGHGVALHALTAETGTGNSVSVDNGAATTLGSVGHLHVTANDRNAGSILIKIQHSTDDAAWADLITFTSVAFAVTTSERLTTSTTVNRYLRAQWTVTGGATGGYTFHVSGARKNV